MKNRSISILLGLSILALIISCNQKEKLTTTEEEMLKDQTTTLDNQALATADADVVTLMINDGTDTDASEGEVMPEQLYCLYMVLSAEGENCPEEWVRFYKFCVDCPSSGRCPGHHSEETPYELLDGDGNVICTGKMRRQIVLPDLNLCDDCPEDEGFKKGYVFVE